MLGFHGYATNEYGTRRLTAASQHGPVYITCNGADISRSVYWPSVDLLLVLTKEVSTLDFEIRLTPGQTTPPKTVPALGDTIVMYDSSGQIFAGKATGIDATIQGLMLTYRISCTDWSYLLDGNLVVKTYTNQDPQDIVMDIISTFAAGKGFTTNHVQKGNFMIPSIRFNYKQPTKCLEALAKDIGWEWFVDSSKDIHFFQAENSNAPITIDETSGQIEWNSLEIERDLQNLKNSVYVIGGTYSKTFTATTTKDVYQTDGTQTTFPLAYAYDKETIQVTVDGVSKTVGIDQQDNPSGFEAMYNDSRKFVYLTANPGSGHTVKIFGDAPIPILAHATDASSIATYGEYQDSILDSQITTVAEAQQRAKAEILQFGTPQYNVTVKTLVAGCRVGQNVVFNSSKFGIMDYPLVIKRIHARVFAPGSQSQLEYQIQAMGSDNVTFVDVMSVLLQQQAQNTVVDSSIVLEVLESIPENVAISDAVTASSGSPPYKWGPSSPQPRWDFFTWS